MKTLAYRPQSYAVDVMPNWFDKRQSNSRIYKTRRYIGLGYNFRERRHLVNSKSRIGSYLHYVMYHAPKNVQLRWNNVKIQSIKKEHTLIEFKKAKRW